MKFRKIFLLLMGVFSFSAFGCQNANTPLKSSLINNSLTVKVNSSEATIGLSVDYDKEYFTWSCKTDFHYSQDDGKLCFYFNFFSDHSEPNIELYNSDEFVYTDENEESITFARNEKDTPQCVYEFYGSKTIKISYQKASDKVKEAIASKNYSICDSTFTWEGEAEFDGIDK